MSSNLPSLDGCPKLISCAMGWDAFGFNLNEDGAWSGTIHIQEKTTKQASQL